LTNLKDLATSGLMQNFQSFLKDENVRLSDDEKVLVCTFLVTSEYCLETAQQLEVKLKEKCQPDLTSQIDMSQEQDVYHSVINTCVSLLAQELESGCSNALSSMHRINWSQVEVVGDQSAYVTALVAHVKQNVPLIR